MTANSIWGADPQVFDLGAEQTDNSPEPGVPDPPQDPNWTPPQDVVAGQ